MVEEDGSGLESVKPPQSLSKNTPVITRNLLSSDPELGQERQRRRLLAASEKIVSARLSIDEVLLSLSSRGKEHSIPWGGKKQFWIFRGRKGERRERKGEREGEEEREGKRKEKEEEKS